jgi:exopolyphosphatase/pppGpp-phosphohydrolase
LGNDYSPVKVQKNHGAELARSSSLVPVRVGVIEVGSRAVRLLVADISRHPGQDRITTIYTNYSNEVKLGSLSSRIPESLAKIARTVRQYKHEAASRNPERIMVFGTQAVRELAATRGFDFAKIAAEIKILDQHTEASCSLIAAVKGLKIRDSASVLMMDQGAASFEVAIGKVGYDIDPTSFSSVSSRELGSEKLMWHFQHCRWDVSTFKHRLSDIFKHLTLPVAASVEYVVGLGSVATECFRLDVAENKPQKHKYPQKHRYKADRVHGRSLTVGNIDRMVMQIGGPSWEQLAFRQGPIPPWNLPARELERLVAGLTAFRELLRYYSKDRFLVSTWGTRHGAAWQLAWSGTGIPRIAQ